ncbi:Thaumatin-like protein [Vigna angularis]|uniref:Thaumatin-like protein n=1 Tax=Phaseolus angularis TaxID=3914 RepID=A0A8T0LFL4_PHAAN|nr:Thaumatin-like protein [Vigna angularis]
MLVEPRGKLHRDGMRGGLERRVSGGAEGEGGIDGPYATPETCKASSYSELLKSACPRAYSFAYDDATSTFTCASANYLITFCPSSTKRSIKSGNGKFPVAVDISVGHGYGEKSPKLMILGLATVLLTIWWELS